MHPWLKQHFPKLIALSALLLLMAACGRPAYIFREDLRINEALEAYRPLPGRNTA